MLESALIGLVGFFIGFGAALLLLRKNREAMRATIEALNVRFAESQATLRAEREKNAWTDQVKEQFKNTFKVRLYIVPILLYGKR